MLTSIANADCPYFQNELLLVFHKRRAAHIKVIKKLIYEHDCSSFCEFIVTHYTPEFYICQ